VSHAYNTRGAVDAPFIGGERYSVTFCTYKLHFRATLLLGQPYVADSGKFKFAEDDLGPV